MFCQPLTIHFGQISNKDIKNAWSNEATVQCTVYDPWPHWQSSLPARLLSSGLYHVLFSYPLILLSPYPVSCILGPINKNAAMSGRTLSANCYLGSAALKSFINGTNNLNWSEGWYRTNHRLVPASLRLYKPELNWNTEMHCASFALTMQWTASL